MAAETIEGRIVRIRYHDVGKGSRSGVPFLIAEVSTTGPKGKGRATIKGEMMSPSFEDTYRFVGEWRAQKGYEDAFEFSYFEDMVEATESGIVQYLARKIDGLGKKKAAALYAAFGADTLNTLQVDPQLATQAEGVTEKNAESIAKFFAENRRIDPVAVAKLLDLFAGHRFPKKLAEQLVYDFGSDAPKLAVENPYLLLAYPRTGWQTVDPFALRVGYDVNGVYRHKAAIVEAFEQHSREGHTYATKMEVDALAFALLGTRPSQASWVAAVRDGDVFSFDYELESRILAEFDEFNSHLEYLIDNHESKFALPRLAYAERNIASHLARLAESARPLPFEPTTEGLNDDQAAAIRMFRSSGVSMLLGAPGTGKTFTVARFIRDCVANGVHNLRSVAPTGKAAKRSEELIVAALGDKANKIVCSTVHRALEPQPGEAPLGVPSDAAKIGRGREGFTFRRNEHEPLDVDLLICDESSMVDASLQDQLLRAVKSGTRVIFVGDTNQLPSVGPGSVLRDMKASGCIPFVELNRIVRSDGGGRVVRACHAVKDGRVPEPADAIDLPLDNWVHIELNEPESIAAEIRSLHESIRANGNYDPYWDVQVVSPQKESEWIGCRDLNTVLSDLLNRNPQPATQGEAAQFRQEFRTGDKVVRTKNGVVDQLVPYDPNKHEKVDWRWDGQSWAIEEVDVVNGDMGFVREITEDGKRQYVICQFRNPERLCRLPKGECHISAAFAMTCHKSQGSGFKVVIVPVHLKYAWNPKTNTGLFSKELFYTAISRAEVVLVTVGQWAAVEAVVKRETVGYRRTLLAGRIREAFATQKAKEPEEVVCD